VEGPKLKKRKFRTYKEKLEERMLFGFLADIVPEQLNRQDRTGQALKF
jgi:hypothetical protein